MTDWAGDSATAELPPTADDLVVWYVNESDAQ